MSIQKKYLGSRIKTKKNSILKYVKKKSKNFLIWINRNFQKILNIIILLISVFALILSIQQIKLSKDQFIENSKSSDILFKAQNEELRKLQSITSSQIEITKNLLKEIIHQSRPKISLLSINSYYGYEIYLNDTNPSITNVIEIENVGGRVASNIKVIFISFLNDFSINSNMGKFNIIENLNPSEKYNNFFKLEISKTIKDFHYLYLKVIYYDMQLQKTFEQNYYYKFDRQSTNNGEICSTREINKINKMFIK